MNFRTTLRAALMASAVIALSGCETMEHTVATVREKISSIELPSFRTTDDATAPTQKEEMAAAETSDCPPVEVIRELNSMHQFMDGKSTRAGDLVSSITMTGFKSACKRNENNLIVDLDIDFEGALGPKAQAWSTEHPSFAYPWFIALTSPDGGITAKEVFGITVTYEKGQDQVSHQEHLRQIIPMQGDFAAGQEVLMGFQLTDADLAYNRSLINGDVAEKSEAALTKGKPALVYAGDPAVDAKAKPPVKKKKKKAASPAKPAQKPESHEAAPVAAESAAPAVPAETPAPAVAPTPVAAEPVAVPAASEAPAAPAAQTETTPPGGTQSTPAAAAPPATGPVPADDANAPPSVEILDDQTGTGPMPPPLNAPAAAPGIQLQRPGG